MVVGVYVKGSLKFVNVNFCERVYKIVNSSNKSICKKMLKSVDIKNGG